MIRVMHTPEELTDEEREELHSALKALEKELEASLALARQSGKPVALDQAAVGRISRGDALQQQQMALAAQRSNELRLGQIKRALAAFEEDRYGECAECDEPIGYRRLRSRPETPLCVACQAGHEAR